MGKMRFNDVCMTIIYGSVEISICAVGVCGNSRFVPVANAHLQEEGDRAISQMD
jgi:hypothetical protein